MVSWLIFTSSLVFSTQNGYDTAQNDAIISQFVRTEQLRTLRQQFQSLLQCNEAEPQNITRLAPWPRVSSATERQDFGHTAEIWRDSFVPSEVLTSALCQKLVRLNVAGTTCWYSVYEVVTTGSLEAKSSEFKCRAVNGRRPKWYLLFTKMNSAKT